jgi:hypothetical protein
VNTVDDDLRKNLLYSVSLYDIKQRDVVEGCLVRKNSGIT